MDRSDIDIPVGEIQTLLDTFHEQWLRLWDEFIANTTPSVQSCDKVPRRLRESVMHVILKLDAV